MTGTLVETAYPRISGHEYCAEVAAVGKNVRGMYVGQLVTGNPYFNCGTCYSCRRGLTNCCTSNATCGVQRDGVFSTYTVMPAERLYDVSGLAPHVAALIEPFSIGHFAVKQTAVKRGERMLIVGAGSIGMLAAVSALSFGAEVTICDISPDKLRLAEEFGIQHTILNDGNRPLQDYVEEYTDGNGYDTAIECAGLSSTVQDCIDSLAFGGRMSIVGVVKHPFLFNIDVIRHKYLTVIGARNALKEDFMETIAIARQGIYPLEKVISRIFPVEEAAAAYDFFDKNGSTSFKVMLEF